MTRTRKWEGGTSRGQGGASGGALVSETSWKWVSAPHPLLKSAELLPVWLIKTGPDGVTMQRLSSAAPWQRSQLPDAPGPLTDMRRVPSSRTSGVTEPLTIFQDLRV